MSALRGKLKLLTAQQLARLEALTDEFIQLNTLLATQEKLALTAKNLTDPKPKVKRKARVVAAKKVKAEDEYLARIRAANNWTAEELEAKLQKAREVQKH